MNQRQLLFKARRPYKDILLKDVQLNRVSTQELQKIYDFIKQNEDSIKANIYLEKKNLDALIRRNKLLREKLTLQNQRNKLEFLQGDLIEKFLNNDVFIKDTQRQLSLQKGAIAGTPNQSLNGSVGFVRELEQVRVNTFKELRELREIGKREQQKIAELDKDLQGKLKPFSNNINKLTKDILPNQVREKYDFQDKLIREEADNFTERLLVDIPRSIREGFDSVIRNSNKNIVGGNQLKTIQTFTKEFGANIKSVYEKLASINFLNQTGITNTNTRDISKFLGQNINGIFKDSINSLLTDLRIEIKEFFRSLKQSINSLNQSIAEKLPRAYPDLIREITNIAEQREISRENTQALIEQLTNSKNVVRVEKLINELENKVNNSADVPDPFARVNNQINTVTNAVKSGIIDNQIAGLLLKDKAEENLTLISQQSSVLRFLEQISKNTNNYGDNERVNSANRVISNSQNEISKFEGIINTLNDPKLQSVLDPNLSKVVNSTVEQLEGAIASLEFNRDKAISDFKASFSDLDNSYLDIYNGTLDRQFNTASRAISSQSDSYLANRRILELELENKRSTGQATIEQINSEIADIIATPLPSDPVSAQVEQEERKVKIAKLEFDKANIEQEIKDVEDRLLEFGDLFSQVFKDVGNNITESIKGFFDGVIDGKENALDAIRDIPKQIQKILVRSLIDRFIAPLFKPFNEPEKEQVNLQRSNPVQLQPLNNVNSEILALSESYQKIADDIKTKFDAVTENLEDNTVKLLERNLGSININLPLEELEKFYQQLVDKLANTVDLRTVNRRVESIDGTLKEINRKLDLVIDKFNSYQDSKDDNNSLYEVIIDEFKNEFKNRKGGDNSDRNKQTDNEQIQEKDTRDAYERYRDRRRQSEEFKKRYDEEFGDKKEKNWWRKEGFKWRDLMFIPFMIGEIFMIAHGIRMISKWAKNRKFKRGNTKKKGRDKDDDDDNNNSGGGGLSQTQDYEVGEGISEADEQKWGKETVDEVNEDFKRKRRTVTQEKIRSINQISLFLKILIHQYLTIIVKIYLSISLEMSGLNQLLNLRLLITLVRLSL